jgi:sodium transport system permease protein
VNFSRHVFAKEITEMMRDKRVVQSALIGPVFLVLMFVFLFGFLQSTLKEKKGQKIHVVKTKSQPSFIKALKKGNTTIVSIDSREKGEDLVKTGDAKVVLIIPEDFDDSLQSGKQAKVTAIYDEDQPASEIGLGSVNKVASALNTIIVKEILKSKQVSAELAEPIKVERTPVKRKDGGMGGFLAVLMPYLIVIWSFYGGFSQASDMVAGEKERSTLETLLISPVPRLRIALGKFWALTALCLTSSLSSLIAVLLAGSLPIPMIKGLFPTGIHVNPAGVASILAVIIPLSAMFAGLLLAISTVARNIRECQSYLTLISFIVLMPAIFSQFIGYTDFAKAAWVSWVPILNSAMVLRSAMLGNFELTPFLTTLFVNVVLALIALRAVVTMFSREKVLWRI